MPYLKTSEIAKILRISLPTVRRLIADGQIKAIRVGSQNRVRSDELVRFMTQNA